MSWSSWYWYSRFFIELHSQLTAWPLGQDCEPHKLIRRHCRPSDPAERNRASKPPKVYRDFDVMPATTISVIGVIQVLLLPKDVTKGTSSEALVSLATLAGVTWICLVFFGGLGERGQLFLECGDVNSTEHLITVWRSFMNCLESEGWELVEGWVFLKLF